jgi:hypothetical protein
MHPKHARRPDRESRLKITIAKRLKPFFHLAGTSCLIPWSPWKIEAYPTLLKFENLITAEKQEFRLDWKGPVVDFTVELDLEKGVVWVYGRAADGYHKMCIEVGDDGIKIEKKPLATSRRNLEKLFLGMSKKLDWELVSRRRDMAEILPIWFRLGQMVPEAAGKKVGVAALLEPCNKNEVTKLLLKTFMAGFEGILSPRLVDTKHQGILGEGRFSESPLILLTEGAKYIRSLFFQETKEAWNFLPCLSPEFHAGRLLQLETKAGDKIDFEWSKKLLQKVVIHPVEEREILICLPKPLKSWRLRTSLKDKGSRCLLDLPLSLTPRQTLFLDRFEK